jgi:hypothetical protein
MEMACLWMGVGSWKPSFDKFPTRYESQPYLVTNKEAWHNDFKRSHNDLKRCTPTTRLQQVFLDSRPILLTSKPVLQSSQVELEHCDPKCGCQTSSGEWRLSGNQSKRLKSNLQRLYYRITVTNI